MLQWSLLSHFNKLESLQVSMLYDAESVAFHASLGDVPSITDLSDVQMVSNSDQLAKSLYSLRCLKSLYLVCTDAEENKSVRGGLV